MWRNVVDGYRDLYLIGSDDGIHFDAARKQGTGTWKINACPMDGGGFAVDGGAVTSAWRRESNIFLAEPGKPEEDLGPGKDGSIARSKRGIYVVWTKESTIVAKVPGKVGLQTIGSTGGFVTLLALPDGAVVAAWESRGSIETRRIE